MTSRPDLQPVLRGQLLHLRPLRSDDFDALFAVASDPLIWEQHPARDRYQPDVFRAFFDEAMASGGALIATDARDGHVIGGSRYHGYNAEQSEIEIGWTFLARAYWGGKYNGEMKELMLRHAFTFVDRVIFLIGTENIRSQRAVEKIGAVPAGTRIDGYGRERLAFEIAAATFQRSLTPALGFHGVRYQVTDVDRSVEFYTRQLGFKLEHQQLPAFASVSFDNLTLLLSGPGASGSRPMPDGRRQESGGWNRVVLRVADLKTRIEALRTAGLRFRNEMEVGPGGRQILLEDPDGNAIELFEPAR